MPSSVQFIFTDRRGGVSAPPFSSFNLGDHVGDRRESVLGNRVRLAAIAGLRPARIVWMDQVHSSTIEVIHSVRSGGVPATDGLVTGMVGLALAVLVADCVPLLAFDASAQVIGAAHAGRQGAASGIGRELIGAMITQGATAPNIRVVLGPAVCGRCYEVPAQMRDEVAAQLPGSAATSSQGTPALDLRAGLRQQLHRLGVLQVDVDPRCTVEDVSLFSHRREGSTGRQAGLIWLAAAGSDAPQLQVNPEK